MRVLEQADELMMDLTGIMTLQRKPFGKEQDLAAIQYKLNALEKEAKKIIQRHLDEAVIIQKRTGRLRKVWEQPTEIPNV